jgi:LysM repeat protein
VQVQTGLLIFYVPIARAQSLAARKGTVMDRIFFLLFILYSLFVASPMPAAAESQTWKVRPDDNLDIIATTLEIPKEEIKKHNPGVLESNLQIGQKLKLPLRSYVESKTLGEELGKKDARIGKLERKSSDLEKKIASAESQLAWQPIWLWGFWISFGIVAFIVSGAYWIFRETHPRVFEQPHDRSIGDLRESEIRVRSSFPHDEEGANSRGGQWQPSLKRLSAHR